ncbi:hypothetical protein F511_11973 [Dorcoceras hygrometricum]|uniref:Uncharacterized protein n=1 Tax=Dorcoceras hygrometricum TaxID=472368 RepID=A0A2Z7CMA0_9LAMI|nr:hypothetical protein F511_11973 [Dorcoceras hygrometricum]
MDKDKGNNKEEVDTVNVVQAAGKTLKPAAENNIVCAPVDDYLVQPMNRNKMDTVRQAHVDERNKSVSPSKSRRSKSRSCNMSRDPPIRARSKSSNKVNQENVGNKTGFNDKQQVKDGKQQQDIGPKNKQDTMEKPTGPTQPCNGDTIDGDDGFHTVGKNGKALKKKKKQATPFASSSSETECVMLDPTTRKPILDGKTVWMKPPAVPPILIYEDSLLEY